MRSRGSGSLRDIAISLPGFGWGGGHRLEVKVRVEIKRSMPSPRTSVLPLALALSPAYHPYRPPGLELGAWGEVRARSFKRGGRDAQQETSIDCPGDSAGIDPESLVRDEARGRPSSLDNLLLVREEVRDRDKRVMQEDAM